MDGINNTVTTRELRSQLSDVLGRAGYGGERIGVTRNGKLAAVIIGIADLEALEVFEEQCDLAAYQKALQDDDGSSISIEDFRKELHA